MKFEVSINVVVPPEEPVVGNVYRGAGGANRTIERLKILAAVDGQRTFFWITDLQGKIVSTAQSQIKYLRKLSPIAFVAEMEGITFSIDALDARDKKAGRK